MIHSTPRTDSVLTMIMILAWLSRAAVAQDYTVVPDPTLVDQADAILHGKVVDKRVVLDQGRIATRYGIEKWELFKGDVADVQVQVDLPGGELPDGRFQYVLGLPTFELDDEVLFFLVRKGETSWRVLHLVQGAFVALRTGPDDGSWLRFVDDDRHHVPGKRSSRADLEAHETRATGVRDAERFARWVRDRAQGIERPVDYFEARSETEIPAKFSFFTVFGPRFRWFMFDEGRPLTWFRHADGQADLPDGGERAFRMARRHWNSEPNTSFRLGDGGTTTTVPSIDDLEGISVIMFSDLIDFYDTDYSCAVGGGGNISAIMVQGTSNEMRPWNGLEFRDVSEAFILMNDGVDCVAATAPGGPEAFYAWYYAHALGHALGLGHSCGSEAKIPNCGDPVLTNSIMTTPLEFFPPRLPAPVPDALSADDRAGIRFLYESDAGSDCPFAVGTGPYCTQCGPCGEGQGDCDSDLECAAGLVCRNDVGAMFGFAPGVDVCVASGTPPGGSDCGLPNGHPRRCSDPRCGPCDEGEGDCDDDAECASGLRCMDNVGAEFGFAPGIDVCVTTGTPPGDCPLPNGDPKRCSDPRCGPCAFGEGDCDDDAECAGSLSCVDNVGADFGFAPGIDVCMGACSETLGSGPYCSVCGPCSAGQGDCDSDAECAPGLTCVDNVGADFGFAPGVDVCM